MCRGLQPGYTAPRSHLLIGRCCGGVKMIISGFPLPEVEQAEVIRMFIELMQHRAATDSCETEISVRISIHPPKDDPNSNRCGL
jgi:hypothetical protein